MKRLQWVAVMGMLASFTAGAWTDRLFAVAQTRPPQPGAERPKPQRWEYCSLARAQVGASRGGLYWISYFGSEGVRVVEVEEQATERGGPAKAIAQLGSEGWEMVGQGPLEGRQGGQNAIFFKRPKN